MFIAKIPGKLNNDRLLGVMERLRKNERWIGRNFSAGNLSNMEIFQKRIKDDPSFETALIERQADFSDMALGKSNLAISGCEVIAVYNLLQSYSGRDFAVSLPTLIEIFEKDGILRAGHFGVSPKAIAEYLKGIGLPINYTTDITDFDVLGYYCDHFILTVLNDREDIFKQIHTFYISKENNNFISHNAGLRMRYHSISEIIGAIPSGRAKGLCLIGLKEPVE